MLQKPVNRPKVLESTALGAAFLAGLSVGYWNFDDIANKRAVDQEFVQELEPELINRLLKQWHKAVERSKQWIEDE